LSDLRAGASTWRVGECQRDDGTVHEGRVNKEKREGEWKDVEGGMKMRYFLRARYIRKTSVMGTGVKGGQTMEKEILNKRSAGEYERLAPRKGIGVRYGGEC